MDGSKTKIMPLAITLLLTTANLASARGGHGGPGSGRGYGSAAATASTNAAASAGSATGANHGVGTSGGFQMPRPKPAVTTPFPLQTNNNGVAHAVGTGGGFQTNLPANTGQTGLGVTSNGAIGQISRSSATSGLGGYGALGGLGYYGYGGGSSTSSSLGSYPSGYGNGSFVPEAATYQGDSSAPPESSERQASVPMVEFYDPPQDPFFNGYERDFNDIATGRNVPPADYYPAAPPVMAQETLDDDSRHLNAGMKLLIDYKETGQLGTFDFNRLADQVTQLRQQKQAIKDATNANRRDELQSTFDKSLADFEREIKSHGGL